MPWRSDGAYVVRRIGISVVQLLGVAFFAFMLIHFVPGNPIATCSARVDAEADPPRQRLASGSPSRTLSSSGCSWSPRTFHFGHPSPSPEHSSLIAQRAVPSIA